MANLRQFLLEEKTELLNETISDPTIDRQSVYNELCELYAECELKNVTLNESVRNLLVKFIVEYRLLYSNGKGPQNEENDSSQLDIDNRVKLLIEIMEDYPDFRFTSDDEMYFFLKFIAKIMNIFVYCKGKYGKLELNKLPWEQIRFIICIFVATKTDRKHTRYQFIDSYFQLLTHKQLIFDALKCLLNSLKNELYNPEDWKNLRQKFNMIKSYYLLLKIWHYLDYQQRIEWKDFKDKSKCMERALQIIGECFVQIDKLRHLEDENQIIGISNVRSALKGMRDSLSHFFVERGQLEDMDEGAFCTFRIDLLKLHINISESIVVEKRLIEKYVIEEYLTMNSVGNLEQKVNEIDVQKINLWSTSENDSFSWLKNRIYELIESVLARGRNRTLVEKYAVLRQSMQGVAFTQINHIEKANIFHFIRWFQNQMEPLTWDQIESKLRANLQFLNGKYHGNHVQSMEHFVIDLGKFAKSIDECKEKLEIMNIFSQIVHFNQINTVKSNVKPDEEEVISNYIHKIQLAIKSTTDQKKFQSIIKDLKLKRNISYELKLLKDFNAVKGKWPKSDGKLTAKTIESYQDPLLCFFPYHKQVLKKNQIKEEDQAEHKIIYNFLDKINFESKNEIVSILKEEEQTKLKEQLEEKLKTCVKSKDPLLLEMILLECLEILKLLNVKFSKDRNYLDFICIILVGRNLRNFLGHGDIFLELFHQDTNLVVRSHIEIILENFRTAKLLGFCRKDDYVQIKDDFLNQRDLIRRSSQLLNWNFDPNVLENIIDDSTSFKIRDHNNLTIVHHNLKRLTSNNPFLLYLVRKINNPLHFQSIGVFERMLKDSLEIENRNINGCLEICDPKSVNLYIDDFLIADNKNTQRAILGQILCFSQTNLLIDLFNAKPLDFEFPSNLLHIAVANNRIDLVNFLLQKPFYKSIINEKYYSYSPLAYAVLKNNPDMILTLVNHGANLNVHFISALHKKFKDFELNLSRGSIFAYDIEDPACIAAANGNLNILKFLHRLGADLKTLDSFSPILMNVQFNTNPEIIEFMIEVYPDLKNWEFEDGKTIMHIACAFGRKEIVRVLIENGVSLDHWNKQETMNVLHYACSGFQDPDFIQYLINKGAPVNTIEKTSPLMIACREGSLEIVEVLLKNKANPLQTLPDGTSPLVWAIISQSTNKIELLSQHGVSKFPVKVPDEIITGSINFFKYFIDNRPTLEWVNKLIPDIVVYGKREILRSALDFIKRSDDKFKVSVDIDKIGSAITRNNLETVSVLLESKNFECPQDDLNEILRLGTMRDKMIIGEKALLKGAQINYRVRHLRNLTLLHLACASEKRLGTRMVKFLLENGAEVNPRNEFNRTPLDVAIDFCDGGVTKIMKMLSRLHAICRYGIDFFVFTPEDQLYFGVLQNDIVMINGALKRGVDINCKFKKFHNGNVLHIACSLDLTIKKGVNKFLLTKKADLSAKDDDDCTPIELAVISGTTELYQIFLEQKKITEPDFAVVFTNIKPKHLLLRGLLENSISRVQSALIRGVDLNIVLDQIHLWTPLHLACARCSVPIVELLLNEGADLFQTDYEGLTPLTLAVAQGNSEVVHSILIANVGLNGDLSFLLKFATLQNKVKVVEVLLELGADINSVFEDSANETPLIIACSLPNNTGLEMVKLFLRHDQCNVNAKSLGNITAFHKACLRKNELIAEVILLSGKMIDYT